MFYSVCLWNEYVTIAVNRNLSNCENSPKKRFSWKEWNTEWNDVNDVMCDGHILISFVFPQFTSFHSVFHSFHGLMNSINWPASSVWVFIAQLGEHCSANAEATGSNPVEAPKIFFSGYFRNCLNCDSLRWSHTHFICIPAVHIISFSVCLCCIKNVWLHLIWNTSTTITGVFL